MTLLILQLMEFLFGFQLAGREDDVADLDLLEIPLNGDLLVDGEIGILRENVPATIAVEDDSRRTVLRDLNFRVGGNRSIEEISLYGGEVPRGTLHRDDKYFVLAASLTEGGDTTDHGDALAGVLADRGVGMSGKVAGDYFEWDSPVLWKRLEVGGGVHLRDFRGGKVLCNQSGGAE